MRKTLISLLAAIVLLCSSSTLSFAQGGEPPKDADRMQAIQKLNAISGGDLDFNEENGQFFLSGKLSGKLAAGSSAALQFLQSNKAVFGITTATDELKKAETLRDDRGETFIKYNQTIKGLKVEGCSVTVHFDRNGIITSVNGKLTQNRAITTLGKTVISQSDAVEIAKQQFTFTKLRKEPTAEKVVTTVGGKNYQAYKVNVFYEKPEIGNFNVFVEAFSGKVIGIEDNIRYDGVNATGSGQDVVLKTRPLNLTLSGGVYYMEDFTRLQKGIWTADMQNTDYSYTVVRNSTNVFNSENFKASVSAHYFAGQVIGFYKKVFSRNSLDNKGMEIDSFTHYSYEYNNAFWDGSEMIYGDGDGNMFTYLSGDLDVVGHEMTHGVISNTCNLYYHNQSGAMNESLADTFGVLIETYNKYNVANGGTWAFNTADWVVGDEIYTPAIAGDALRSLSNPALYDQPADMAHYQSYPDTRDGDWGGVHTNSGIPNRASYLIAKSIGMARTAYIYYRAMTYYMGSSTDFTNAALCFKQAAKDYYGTGSAPYNAVVNAFSTVGVTQPAVSDPFEPNNNMKTAFEIFPGTTKAYCTSNGDEDWYKINVYGAGNLHIGLTNIPDGCDYDLYLFSSEGGASLAHSYEEDQTPEAIDYPISQAGTYYVLVQPYRGCSSVQMYSLSVTLPGKPVTGMSLAEETLRLPLGWTHTMVAKISPADAANHHMYWSSSNPLVATVDRFGKVTAKTYGTTTITATTAVGGFKDTCLVTVPIMVKGVNLNKHTAGYLVGDKEKLVATVSPSNATDKTVTWSSTNSAVASVDATGLVTAKSTGTATITVKTKDGGYKDTCAVTVATQLTAPVVNMVTTTYNSVTLGWKMVCGARGYEIRRASTANGTYVVVGMTTGLTFTNTGLTLNKAYYYKVYPFRGNPKKYGPGSTAIAAKPLPSAPAPFKVAPLTYNSIKVSWGAVAGATKYELYSSTAKAGTYKLLSTTTALSYTNTGLATGTTYYYKARAYRLVGSTKVYGSYTVITAGTPSLAAPASIKAVKASASSIKVTWGKVSGASGYELFRATVYGGTFYLIKSTTSLYYTNTGLTAGNYYYYIVRAYRTVSGKKVYGPVSDIAYAKP